MVVIQDEVLPEAQIRRDRQVIDLLPLMILHIADHAVMTLSVFRGKVKAAGVSVEEIPVHNYPYASKIIEKCLYVCHSRSCPPRRD